MSISKVRGRAIPDAEAGAAIHRQMLKEETALAEAKERNPQIEDQLNELNSPAILKFIHGRISARLGSNNQDVNDVAHDIWLRAKEAIQRGAFHGGEGSNFRGWLGIIIFNFLNTKYRQDKRITPLAEEMVENLPSPWQDYEEWERTEDGKRLLAQLTAQLRPVFREVFMMRHRDGLEYAEIARRLGVPPGTVMSRLARATALLRKLYEGEPTRDKAA